VRSTGGSHYGLSRTFRVLFDIITIRFLLKYMTRPMHFFGALGLAGTTIGGALLGWLAFEKIFMRVDIIDVHGPLMVGGALLLLSGLMMFSTGLIGELLMRTYFESQNRRIYAIREIISTQQTHEEKIR
jgi:hypothetical protein